MPRLRNAEECAAAALKGKDWVLSQALEDGSFRSAGGAEAAGDGQESSLWAYHKAPVLFCRSGDGDQAARLLHWMSRRLMPATGLFRGTEEDGEDEALLQHADMNAWVCRGAHLCARYDLSFAGCAYLAACQGKEVGGVYNRRRDGSRCATHDVVSAASAGLAFLCLGRMAEARRAGAFLIRALENQPAPKRFYVRFDGEAKPATEFPESLAQLYVVDGTQTGQQYGFLGVPAVLLARLARATGETEFLEGAKEYFRLAEGCAADLFGTLACGKVGWAGAVLYAMTRRRRYYEAAEKAAVFLVAAQDAEGRWFDRSACETGDAQSQADSLSLTSEMSVLLFECLSEIQ